MEKYISSLDDLDLSQIFNTSGGTGDIYSIEEDILFKLYDLDYRDLNDKYNLELLDNLNRLSTLGHFDHFIMPIDTYRSRDEFFGHTMKQANGCILSKVDRSRSIGCVINSFLDLNGDVLKLSNNKFRCEDVGGDNILFGDKFYLIDFDLGDFNSDYSSEELYRATYFKLFSSIHCDLIGSCTLLTGDILHRYLRLKNKESDDYLGYFDLLLDSCSCTKDSSISDVSKIYRKKYSERGGIYG